MTEPTFDGNEGRYVAECLASGRVASGGPFTARAVDLLQRIHGSRAFLTSSCTHALELSARLLDLRPGDEVIVPSFAFVTTVSAFVLTGAVPVFVDIRPDTLNLEVEAVEAAITPRTRVVCAVHYAGVAAEPDRLASVATRRGLDLVEDNAHGLTGSFKGRPLGTFGSLSALSFHETKNVTCGEGGALIVNEPSYEERAQVLLEKGTNRAAFLRGDVARYTWVDLGSSWGLAEPLAALLTAQLERLDQIQRVRHARWSRYADELSDWAREHAVSLPVVPANCEHTAHVFRLLMPSTTARDRFISHLHERDVQAAFHYQPLHDSAMGRRFGAHAGQCPVAENVAATLVRIPIHACLTDDEQSLVIDAVRSFQFTP